MKVKGYTIISVIMAAVVIFVSCLLLLLAGFSYELKFISYVYSEYIDRSESQIFLKDAGAQLYEAETAKLIDSAQRETNIGASGYKSVRFSGTDSIMRYEVAFDEDCTIQIILAVNLLTSKYYTYADDLFSLVHNGHTVNIKDTLLKDSPSKYNFQENIICTLSCKKGENEIRFISKTAGWAIDYMVLVSEFERESLETTLRDPFYFYDKQWGRYVYEEKKMTNKDTFIIEDRESTNGYATYFERTGSYLTYYIHSASDVTVTFGLRLTQLSVPYEYLYEICGLYVNKESYASQAELKNGEEIIAGVIPLKQGLNEIKIHSHEPGLCLDYIFIEAQSF